MKSEDFSFLTSIRHFDVIADFQIFKNTMAVILVDDNPIYMKEFLKSDDVSFLTSYDICHMI